MQPLKLTLEGQYWDSQIYRSHLYLFARNGDLLTINWDALINSIEVDTTAKLAFECAFTNSDMLYDPRVTRVLDDPEVRPLMLAKFAQLANRSFEISREQLDRFTIGKQSNPFPFPHADSTIYYNKLYVGGSSGVWAATCAKSKGNKVSSRPKRSWDASVFSVAASYRTLACAAGDDGLFQIPLNGDSSGPPTPVSVRNCIDCQWAFQSLYGSSHIDHGFLAEYENIRDGDEFTRVFEGITDDSSIFHDTGYSWGTGDKLCQASQGQVRVALYSPYSKDRSQRLHLLRSFTLQEWKGQVVSGKLATFGAIVECDAAIVIALSDDTISTLAGEPINWRVFPRSVRYENHLHVVYDDNLLVASFNNDYFVDQSNKNIGIKYRSPSIWPSSRTRAAAVTLEDPEEAIERPPSGGGIVDSDLF